MKSIKYITLLVIFSVILVGNKGHCQISKGGKPYSFTKTGLSDSVSTEKMPKVNVDSLLAVDAMQKDTTRPFRFGYAINVDMGLKNSGTWDTLTDGSKIWRLKIHSKDAYSINLIFDKFRLPKGAQFFVYNEERSMILGAFTSEVSNNEYNKFATDLVKGNTLVLEYYEPAYTDGGIINIDKVIHGYKNMFDHHGHGNSQSCNIDVNCSQGNSWCVQKRAVSVILINDNQELCSGCLLNNIREDLTPYYLTAFHCADSDKNGILSQSEINDAQTWLFRFKYWSTTCNQGDGANNWVSISGANFKAGYHPTDMLLLQLSSQPPSGFGVLYAGWDKTSTPAQSGSYIHHPAGDVMKISLYSEPLQEATQPVGNTISWRVKLSEGVVEGGSSGSPLFNQNGLVIGQHKGRDPNNPLTCSNLNAFAYAGRFNVSWTGGGTSSTRLSNWLDPDNTGMTTIGATSPTIYLINRTLTGTNKFAALEDIHIEGNVTTNGGICQPSSIPFTVEPSSNVAIKAKTITIYPETEIKTGSEVVITATNTIQCSDDIAEGDYVDVFCNAEISMLTEKPNDTPKPTKAVAESKLNLSEHIVLYPNPNSGQFQIEFLDNELKSSEIIVYDATGKIVYEQNNIVQNRVQVELCSLQKGIYLVQILHNGNSYTKRIVLQY